MTGARAILLILAISTLMPMVSAQSAGDADVVRVKIDGVVGQGTAIHVERALATAEKFGIPLLIQLDTPGGLVQATLDIDDTLARADVPILTYVGPGGGTYAASAGTIILLMGHVAGMADGATIGSAQAVQQSEDGVEPAPDKVQNFIVERMRSIAERHGRDPDLAERFITENLNMDAEEALASGLIDALGDDAGEYLDNIAGREVTVRGDVIALDTSNARVYDQPRGTLASVIDFIGNPQVAFILVLAGTYGVIFGIANGGTYVPEVMGALLLILGFIGLGLFTTNTAGVILLIMALLFFVVEVFTPTNGILTGVGVVAMIFAVIFLVDEPLLPRGAVRWFLGTGIALSLLMGALTTLAITIALRANSLPAFDVLRGAYGKVIDLIDPTGRVEVNGEVWNAHTKLGPLLVGDRIRVVSHAGLKLEVVPESDYEEE